MSRNMGGLPPAERRKYLTEAESAIVDYGISAMVTARLRGRPIEGRRIDNDEEQLLRAAAESEYWAISDQVVPDEIDGVMMWQRCAPDQAVASLLRDRYSDAARDRTGFKVALFYGLLSVSAMSEMERQRVAGIMNDVQTGQIWDAVSEETRQLATFGRDVVVGHLGVIWPDAPRVELGEVL